MLLGRITRTHTRTQTRKETGGPTRTTEYNS